MYDSRPTQREGEPIRQLVPEAIEATAHTADDGRPGIRGKHLHSTESTVRTLAALVIVEAVVILVLLAGWLIF
ncbi:MAG: hypothetical protein L0G70_02335 [Rubrobacter sp.]|nr:hypothetical protein [Rubrobacter sp.]